MGKWDHYPLDHHHHHNRSADLGGGGVVELLLLLYILRGNCVLLYFNYMKSKMFLLSLYNIPFFEELKNIEKYWKMGLSPPLISQKVQIIL